MDTRVAPVHVHDAQIEACLDGSLLVRNPEPLRSYPPRVTERLEYWAAQMPNRTFVAARSFNDIHRGVPLISRAVLVARLRELEDHGVIERRPRGADGAGHEYWLTPAGEGLRVVMHALGQWGMTYTHDRIKRSDLDPALLIWGLRKRVDLSTLPDRRVVLRFEFSGVPASRTKFRIMWLVLGRSGADVCMKDPGFAVDLTLRGNIRDYVDVYLGHTKWRDVAGTALQFDGDLQIARAFPVWLRFETVNRGRVVNARSGAGKHGGKPRKIGEGRATRSGERPGVSSSHLGAFAKPSRNANVTNSRRSEIEV